jgi:hypothetical protein
MLRRYIATAGLGVTLVALAGAPTVSASGGLLHWVSPKTITSGTAFHVASIDPCPPVPTAGDSVLVQIFLSFGSGGGSGNVLSANPDGSWSGDLTFTFSGVGRSGQLSATCLDFNGVTGRPYAQYTTRHVKLF